MNDHTPPGPKVRIHGVAGCVDCTCRTTSAQVLAKALNGYHTRKAHPAGFHEPILIKPRNAAILQESACAATGLRSRHSHHSARAEDAVRCVHCHRGVGHGARK